MKKTYEPPDPDIWIAIKSSPKTKGGSTFLEIIYSKDAVKEKLIGAINLMSIEDATSLWEYITRTHVSRASLSSIEEAEPTEDEIQILNAYENGDDKYQPYMSHKDLKKELGLL